MVLKVKVSPELIAGDVDQGYGKIADVFRRNMTSGQEIQPLAPSTARQESRRSVGRIRNGITKEPWRQDTIVTVCSTTKGVAALAIAVAVSRGLLSYDAKVVDYWPEFGQAVRTQLACANYCHIKLDCLS